MEIWDFNLRHLAAIARISELGTMNAAAEAVSGEGGESEMEQRDLCAVIAKERVSSRHNNQSRCMTTRRDQ